MSVIGNLIWIILGGLLSAIGWTIVGAILCISVIGIPFGLQCFKIAGLTLVPFGRNVEVGKFGASGFLGNLIWIILFGWELCIGHLFFGAILCISVIGIPFGLQHFKLAKLALLPFGAEID